MGGSSLRRIGEFAPIRGDFIKGAAVTEDIVEQVLCAGWVARVVHTQGPSLAPIDSYVMQPRSRWKTRLLFAKRIERTRREFYEV